MTNVIVRIEKKEHSQYSKLQNDQKVVCILKKLLTIYGERARSKLFFLIKQGEYFKNAPF
jgi:hypothetical protein